MILLRTLATLSARALVTSEIRTGHDSLTPHVCEERAPSCACLWLPATRRPLPPTPANTPPSLSRSLKPMCMWLWLPATRHPPNPRQLQRAELDRPTCASRCGGRGRGSALCLLYRAAAVGRRAPANDVSQSTARALPPPAASQAAVWDGRGLKGGGGVGVCGRRRWRLHNTCPQTRFRTRPPQTRPKHVPRYVPQTTRFQKEQKNSLK